MTIQQIKCAYCGKHLQWNDAYATRKGTMCHDHHQDFHDPSAERQEIAEEFAELIGKIFVDSEAR